MLISSKNNKVYCEVTYSMVPIEVKYLIGIGSIVLIFLFLTTKLYPEIKSAIKILSLSFIIGIGSIILFILIIQLKAQDKNKKIDSKSKFIDQFKYYQVCSFLNELYHIETKNEL